MTIYKRKPISQENNELEKIDFYDADVEFYWSQKEDLSPEVESLFRTVSLKLVFDTVVRSEKMSNAMLKFYKQNTALVKEHNERVPLSDYPWYEAFDHYRINDWQEQEKIKAVFLYILSQEDKQNPKVRQLLLATFKRKIKSYLEYEKQGRKIQRDWAGIVEQMSSSQFTFSEKLYAVRMRDFGTIDPFPDSFTMAYSYEYFESFCFYAFLHYHIEPMSAFHIMIAEIEAYKTLLIWSVMLYGSYFLHFDGSKKEYDQIARENNLPITAERRDVEPSQTKAKINYTFEIGGQEFTFDKKSTVIDVFSQISYQLEQFLRETARKAHKQMERLPLTEQTVEKKKEVFFEQESDLEFDWQWGSSAILSYSRISQNILGMEFQRNTLKEAMFSPISNDEWVEIRNRTQYHEHLIDMMLDEEYPIEFFIAELNLFLETVVHVKALHELGEVNKRGSEVDRAYTRLQAEFDSYKQEYSIEDVNQSLSDKDREIGRLKQELSEYKQKNISLSKVDARIESLTQQLQDKNAEIDSLNKQLDRIEPIVIDRVLNKNRYSADEVLRKLTNEQEVVYFVGGHQQTHVKIKQWLPNLNVIEPRDYTKDVSDKATIVIVNTAYINHPMYWKTQNRVEQLQKKNPSLQLLYLNTQSTNKERILKELAEQIEL